MLLKVEKGIRGGICNSIARYAKANNKYMKDYDKNKELSHLKFEATCVEIGTKMKKWFRLKDMLNFKVL